MHSSKQKFLMHVRTTYHSEVRTATALAGHRVTLGILSTELLTLVAIVAVWTDYKNEDKMILAILKIKKSFLKNVLVKTMAATVLTVKRYNIKKHVHYQETCNMTYCPI